MISNFTTNNNNTTTNILNWKSYYYSKYIRWIIIFILIYLLVILRQQQQQQLFKKLSPNTNNQQTIPISNDWHNNTIINDYQTKLCSYSNFPAIVPTEQVKSVPGLIHLDENYKIQPHMTKGEVKFFLQQLNTHHVYFEFGIGGSTDLAVSSMLSKNTLQSITTVDVDMKYVTTLKILNIQQHVDAFWVNIGPVKL
jgi:hypothetical protein